MTTEKKAPRKRGFASMDPAKRAQIAAEGGRAAHREGRAHKFSSAEAREAGRKGGLTAAANRKKAG